MYIRYTIPNIYLRRAYVSCWFYFLNNGLSSSLSLTHSLSIYTCAYRRHRPSYETTHIRSVRPCGLECKFKRIKRVGWRRYYYDVSYFLFLLSLPTCRELYPRFFYTAAHVLLWLWICNKGLKHRKVKKIDLSLFSSHRGLGKNKNLKLLLRFVYYYCYQKQICTLIYHKIFRLYKIRLL